MKLLSLLLISFLMPVLANAAVPCAAIIESPCPPGQTCISADATLGQTNPVVEADAEAVN